MKDDDGKSFDFSHTFKYIYIYNLHTRFVVSWLGRYSYLNNEQIQISAVLHMNAAYGSSGSFGSRVGSKCDGHNTYTGRRRKLRSKPRTIHAPVNKCELKFSYSRSHFNRLPQVVSKGLIN